MLMNGCEQLSLPKNGEDRVKDIFYLKSSTLRTNVETQIMAKLQ